MLVTGSLAGRRRTRTARWDNPPASLPMNRFAIHDLTVEELRALEELAHRYRDRDPTARGNFGIVDWRRLIVKIQIAKQE